MGSTHPRVFDLEAAVSGRRARVDVVCERACPRAHQTSASSSIPDGRRARHAPTTWNRVVGPRVGGARGREGARVLPEHRRARQPRAHAMAKATVLEREIEMHARMRRSHDNRYMKCTHTPSRGVVPAILISVMARSQRLLGDRRPRVRCIAPALENQIAAPQTQHHSNVFAHFAVGGSERHGSGCCFGGTRGLGRRGAFLRRADVKHEAIVGHMGVPGGR